MKMENFYFPAHKRLLFVRRGSSGGGEREREPDPLNRGQNLTHKTFSFVQCY